MNCKFFGVILLVCLVRQATSYVWGRNWRYTTENPYTDYSEENESTESPYTDYSEENQSPESIVPRLNDTTNWTNKPIIYTSVEVPSWNMTNLGFNPSRPWRFTVTPETLLYKWRYAHNKDIQPEEQTETNERNTMATSYVWGRNWRYTTETPYTNYSEENESATSYDWGRNWRYTTENPYTDYSEENESILLSTTISTAPPIQTGQHVLILVTILLLVI